MVTREEKNKQLKKDIKKEEKKELIKEKKKKIIKIIIIIFLIFLVLFTYMHSIGTKGLKVKEYKIVNNKIPDSFTGFKIVHFSDLYYLSTVNEKDLKKLVNKINELKPDIVVYTGDLFNSNKKLGKKDIDSLTKYLNKIHATIGLYAIKGDHDYTDTYNEIIEKTKFQLINNSYELIYYKDTTPILLTGINSYLKKDTDINQAFSFDKMDNLFTISLIHEPDLIDKIIINKPDIVLAGHSLNGEIRLPFANGLIKKEYARKYYNPKYKINNTTLFISGGIGTENHEFRLFNHPSINFYRLVKETN